MLELFRVEAENQSASLNSGLLEIERGANTPQHFETLMRAAHSLKGAARIVNLPRLVSVAHAMEDCFVAVQHGKFKLSREDVDVLLRGVDLLLQLSRKNDPNAGAEEPANAAEIEKLLQYLGRFRGTAAAAKSAERAAQVSRAPSQSVASPEKPKPEAAPAARDVPRSAESSVVAKDTTPPASMERGPAAESSERVVRLTAENLNRLLGLAGESLVESRWLRPFADSLQRLKRQHGQISQQLDSFRQFLDQQQLSDKADVQIGDLSRSVSECQQFLSERMDELDLFDRRSAHLSHRLYLEVLRTRMRPFADGVRRFPRMVRDLARSLGKEVKLEITGENTQVDRDILERLETPLAHLLRNAVDHGCETSEERRAAGKPAESTIRLDARHSAGMLMVTVSDDGRGVDSEFLRRVIVQKKLTLPALAEKLSESELIEFLFLPGFTVKDSVTEISGRGVGLDVVQNMVKSVRGTIRVTNQPGKGLRFQLQLPLTLSVLRALLVEVAEEPYAIPLSQITRTLKLRREEIESLEGRHHFRFNDQPMGLLSAQQVFDCGTPKPPENEMPVVILGERNARYGLVVDRFLGERELVVQPLDTRLGKIKDISAAALMEDGSPVLIVDVEDLVRSIEKLISGGLLARIEGERAQSAAGKRKRVLAVDDSLTVRELERKILSNRGYVTEIAIDGMDAWNAIRSGDFDLIITDVDMPRMDGIELTKRIKSDPRFKTLPVMIVSYKDHEEDKLRGLKAGADFYLTKGNFHDESLVQAVADLIGQPTV